MTDNPTDKQKSEMTVSELSTALKKALEGSFDRVRVRGEISGFKRAASGHMYFSLKDANAILDGVCWRGTAGRLRILPEDGMEVVASGRITTYALRSRYQMVVEGMELAGKGALLEMLEQRKKKLAQEGLFDEANKKQIPFLPDVIGVVTSPTGAVIRDILHRISERFRRRMMLWPVLVQGNGAAEKIAAAIEGFNKLETDGQLPRPDVLIVARGGGSVEDLMAFNEEIVVRAAFNSRIPLISAIGHETDFTLIDFSADVRAPTPSAAAEMAVPVRLDLIARIMDDASRLALSMNRILEDRRTRLDGLGRGLPGPVRIIDEISQRLDDWSERMENALKGLLRDRRSRFSQAASLLESYSYQRVLERGFALVHDEAGNSVRSVEVLGAGMSLGLRFHDGETNVTVNGKRKKTETRQPPADDPQGSLL